ncbi:MAG: hypothetical protein J6R29_01300 [Clostridia bacterium]|nr:hypothetical protein [Clostridia bacterium]
MTAVKKSKTSLVVSIVSMLLSVVTILALVFSLGSSQVTTTTANATMFKNGAINEDGKVIESNLSAVLSEAKTVKDMNIEIDEESAVITYKVAFYDKDGNFISMTDEQVADFDVNEIPQDADTFRVVVTPNEVDGEAVKINSLNRVKYVKQLKVSFARE